MLSICLLAFACVQGCRCCCQQAFSEDEDEEDLKERLCSAMCCLAETRMGDAGEVSAVAEECEALLLRAAQVDATSPEPMQVNPPCHGLPSTHQMAPPLLNCATLLGVFIGVRIRKCLYGQCRRWPA